LIESCCGILISSGPHWVSWFGEAGSSKRWLKCQIVCSPGSHKSVGSFRQQYGDHGSWNPLRSV